MVPKLLSDSCRPKPPISAMPWHHCFNMLYCIVVFYSLTVTIVHSNVFKSIKLDAYKLRLMMHFIHTTRQYPDYMRDLVSITATTATRTGLRSSSGLSYWKPSSVNVLSAIPNLMRRTRYLSTCRQLLTLALSSVYLKTYLFTTAY